MPSRSRQLGLRRPVQRPKVAAAAAQQPKRWWRGTRGRVATALGTVVTAFVTGIAVKYGEQMSAPVLREVTGDPVYVSAAELPVDEGSEPVVRMLPAGVTDHERRAMSDPSAGPVGDTELGIPVGQVKLRMVVQAKEARVLLTGLRLVVDEARSPLTATLLAIGTQGGGGKPIQVVFDADAGEASTSRGTPARNSAGRDYFAGDNYELDPGQSVEFRVLVTTRHCYCRWHLEVDVTLDGKTRSVAARRDNGMGFEVSAATPNVQEVYEVPHPSRLPKTTLGSIGRWVRVPPAEFCTPGSVCDPSAWPYK
jgi:hypothetical protein